MFQYSERLAVFTKFGYICIVHAEVLSTFGSAKVVIFFRLQYKRSIISNYFYHKESVRG